MIIASVKENDERPWSQLEFSYNGNLYKCECLMSTGSTKSVLSTKDFPGLCAFTGIKVDNVTIGDGMLVPLVDFEISGELPYTVIGWDILSKYTWNISNGVMSIDTL